MTIITPFPIDDPFIETYYALFDVNGNHQFSHARMMTASLNHFLTTLSKIALEISSSRYIVVSKKGVVRYYQGSKVIGQETLETPEDPLIYHAPYTLLKATRNFNDQDFLSPHKTVLDYNLFRPTICSLLDRNIPFKVVTRIGNEFIAKW